MRGDSIWKIARQKFAASYQKCHLNLSILALGTGKAENIIYARHKHALPKLEDFLECFFKPF